MSDWVVVVGCGGLGSWTATILAKSGWKKFVLVDPDRVEEKNLKTQIYFPEDVGELKVDALGRKLKALGAQVLAYPHKFEEVAEELPPARLALALTDNIPSRIEVERRYPKTLHAMVRPGYGMIMITTRKIKLANIMREGKHVGDQEPSMVALVASVAAREAYSYLTKGSSVLEGKILMITPYRFDVLELGERS